MIGHTIVRNRLIHSNASPHFLQGPEEFPAESYMAHFSAIARSGAAIVTMAEWDNWPGQRNADAPVPDFVHMQAFNMKSGAVHNYLSALLEEIHFYGSKALLAIEPKVMGHGGGGAPKDREKKPEQQQPPVQPAVKGNDFHAPRKRVIAMSPEQEDESIREFLGKVELYRELGYDGISVRVDKFVRRSSNPVRTLAERCAFFIRALQAVRDRFGADFIIDVTLQGQQPLGYEGNIAPGDGYSVEDMIQVVRMMEGVIDIFTLRGKDVATAHPLPCHFKKGEQETLDYARALKKAGVNVLVAVNGGYQDPDQIEECLEQGIFDFVSMGRTFICEPEYEQKIREGRPEDITPCLWCNLCHGNFKAPWISVCSVNPRLGMEHKLPRMLGNRSTKPKKVAVIGGGPAGMRAAIYAAQKGHQVTLFEKSDYLGGQMLHAESFSFKWSIRDYRNWLVSQLKKNNVDVRMCTEPSPEDISNEGFDAVIAATGARFNLPDSISGLRDESGQPLYPTIGDVFGKEAELGQRVIIVGGSEAGVETAMYLAENGHDVVVLTRQDELAKDASHLHYITMAFMKVGEDGLSHLVPQWEQYDNIQGICEVTTTGVSGNEVTYRDKDGAEHTISGDSVVICGGSSPRAEEAFAYADAAPQFYVIGDANGAGKLWKCSREAFSRANML